MSKKNRKNNRKANSSVVKFEVTATNNVKVWVVSFDYIKNTFYCPCSGKLYWTGGRFSHNHTLEVLKCERCGRHVDPSLVVSEAISYLAAWEKAKADYYHKAANRAAANYLTEEAARRPATRQPAARQGILSRLMGYVFAS